MLRPALLRLRRLGSEHVLAGPGGQACDLELPWLSTCPLHRGATRPPTWQAPALGVSLALCCAVCLPGGCQEPVGCILSRPRAVAAAGGLCHLCMSQMGVGKLDPQGQEGCTTEGGFDRMDCGPCGVSVRQWSLLSCHPLAGSSSFADSGQASPPWGAGDGCIPQTLPLSPTSALLSDGEQEVRRPLLPKVTAGCVGPWRLLYGGSPGRLWVDQEAFCLESPNQVICEQPLPFPCELT